MGMGLTLVLLVKIGVIGARGDKIALDKGGSGLLVTFLSAGEGSTFAGNVVTEGKGGFQLYCFSVEERSNHSMLY